jgi:hypothetical protein
MGAEGGDGIHRTEHRDQPDEHFEEKFSNGRYRFWTMPIARAGITLALCG